MERSRKPEPGGGECDSDHENEKDGLLQAQQVGGSPKGSACSQGSLKTVPQGEIDLRVAPLDRS